MSRLVCASFQFASVCFIRQVKSALFHRGFGFVLVFFLLLFFPASKLAAETVWIDTDVSIGSPLREVDDAFALLLAFRSPNLEIAGISTSYGNAPIQATTSAARDLVPKFGTRLIIYPGAKSQHDLGRRTEASDALAATLSEQHSLTYVALGPLTNLAAFQTLYPKLARRIKRVIFIGGTAPGTTLRFGSRNPIRIHDANVVKDPKAVAQVLRSRIPITLIPVEIAAQLTVGATDLDAMRGSPAGDFIQQKSRFWLWFWTKFVGTDGAPIFDGAAIFAIADPAQLPVETRIASVDAAGNLFVAPGPRPGGRKVSAVVRLSNPANALNSMRRQLRSAGRVPGSGRGPDGSRLNAPPASR